MSPGRLDLDTMIASYLVDATRSTYPLEDLALEHTSYKALTEEDVCGKGVKALSLGDIPVEAALDFACERADLAGQLAPILRGLLEKEQLADVYHSLELPLIPVLIAIERAGVRIDSAALAVQSRQVDLELTRLMKQIYELAGGEFNINSPSSSPRCSSTGSACQWANEPVRRRRHRLPSKSWKSWRSHTTFPG